MSLHREPESLRSLRQAGKAQSRRNFITELAKTAAVVGLFGRGKRHSERVVPKLSEDQEIETLKNRLETILIEEGILKELHSNDNDVKIISSGKIPGKVRDISKRHDSESIKAKLAKFVSIGVGAYALNALVKDETGATDKSRINMARRRFVQTLGATSVAGFVLSDLYSAELSRISIKSVADAESNVTEFLTRSFQDKTKSESQVKAILQNRIEELGKDIKETGSKFVQALKYKLMIEKQDRKR